MPHDKVRPQARIAVKVRVRKWVVPIQAFSKPNGCSTVRRRIFIAFGIRSSRVCIASSTPSCIQRFTRRAGQPDQLDVALALTFEATARWNAVEIAVQVDLEQRRQMVGGPARGLRHHAREAECRQVKLIDEDFDKTNRIVRSNRVIETVRNERDLLTTLACDEALNPNLIRSGFTIPYPRVFTQPGPEAVLLLESGRREIGDIHHRTRTVSVATHLRN